MADAIDIMNRPRPRHCFNFAVVGRGHERAHLPPTGDRSRIEIRAEVRRKDLVLAAEMIQCVVNTGSRVTVFQGDVGRDLGLAVPDPPSIGSIRTPFNLYASFWGRHRILLSVPPDLLEISVWFPMEYVNHRWRWRLGFPGWNVLGMREVLDKRLLCFAREKLYGFERVD